MRTNHLRRLTLSANLATHFRHREPMQIKAQIQLDADDVAQAIQDYVRAKTGRDIVGSVKAERERGGVAFSVPAAYDLEDKAIEKRGA